MGHLLTGVDAAHVLAVLGIYPVEAPVHLVLGAEGLDYAQSAERLFHLAHRVAPQCLRLLRLLLEPAAYAPHDPSHQRDEQDGEQSELPAYEHHRREVGEDEYRVLEKHVERGHDGAFHLEHVAAHARYYVALALLGEEAQGERSYLVVELVAYVAHYTRAYRYYGGRRDEVGSGLEQGHEGQREADEEQRERLPVVVDEQAHVVFGVVAGHVLERAEVEGRQVFPQPPLHQLHRGGGTLGLEQDLQDGYYCHERHYVQHGREDVEHDGEHKIFFVWRHEAAQYLQKFFHKG